MKLASFDIFDTAVIRKCGMPENIFCLLSWRLFPHDESLRDDFLVWRRHVEQRLKKDGMNSEITLTDIYRDAPFREYTPAQLAESEMAVESENLIADPAVLRQIEEKRSEGFSIAFVSDMYLPKNFLENVLIREKCMKAGDAVFVSCECGARKDTGSLYELAGKQLKPSFWVHYGDNYRSDFKMPRRHHIHAVKTGTGYTAAENKILSGSTQFRDNFQLRLLAGLSRSARIVSGNTPAGILAADFIAPVYLPYVLHVFRTADALGIRKLYFLSRDGYILKKAASALHGGTDMHELFVSRTSLLLPYLACEFSPEAYLLVIEKHTLSGKLADDLLMRLGLSKRMMHEKYSVRFDYDRIVTKEQEQDFLEKLFRSRFSETLKKKAAAAHALAMAYFKQEGLLDGGRFLLIDIGWLGTSRVMINSLLKHAGCQEAEFLYCGVRSDVFPCRFGAYRTYFREGMLSTGSTVLMEKYFSQSPNPSVAGYENNNGKIIPVWEEGRLPGCPQTLHINEAVMKYMAESLRNFPFSEEVLYSWAKKSMDFISCGEGDVDYSPLAEAGDFDSCDFVRKLSPAEIIRIASGRRVTAFDEGSLQVSVGSRCGRLVMHLHSLMIRFAYPAYRKVFMNR